MPKPLAGFVIGAVLGVVVGVAPGSGTFALLIVPLVGIFGGAGALIGWLIDRLV